MRAVTPSWPQVDFDADPRLVLGVRLSGAALSARRVDLHESLFGHLRAVCEQTLEQLRTAVPRPYEPHAQLEGGEEYFWVQIDDLPRREPPRSRRLNGQADEEWDGTASLVAITRHVDRLEPMNATEIRRQKYLFYGMAWATSDGAFITFVKKSDPRQALRPGRLFTRFDQALKRVEDLDLVLEPDFDVVVSDSFVAVLRPAAFSQLLNDVRIAFADVDKHVAAVGQRLGSTIPLTAEAAAALAGAAKRKVSLARRLGQLPDRLAVISFDQAMLRSALHRHGVDATSLLDGQGNFDFGEDAAGVFLDVVEGRYFRDDFGEERRRADRFSVRR